MPDGWGYLFGEMQRTIRNPLGFGEEEFNDFINEGFHASAKGDDFYIESTDVTRGFVVFGFNASTDGYENRILQ